MRNDQAYKRAWYAKNKVRIKAQQAAYRQEHKDAIRKTHKAWEQANLSRQRRTVKKYSETHPDRVRFGVYKSSARKRGIPFEITFAQFMVFWQKPCHYCGAPIATVGIDRVDNNKGYSIGNIVPCCTPCNKSKLDMDPVDYITHCAKVVQHFKMHKGK